MRINTKLIMRSIIKYLLISILWQILELIFYGAVQPRVVDDIIGIFLYYYIFRNEERKEQICKTHLRR